MAFPKLRCGEPEQRVVVSERHKSKFRLTKRVGNCKVGPQVRRDPQTSPRNLYKISFVPSTISKLFMHRERLQKNSCRLGGKGCDSNINRMTISW